MTNKFHTSSDQALDLWNQIDKDHYGKVSRAAWLDAYAKLEEFDEERAGNLFDQWDMDKDGYLGFAEFTSMACILLEDCDESKVKQTFDSLDSDGTGFLTL